MKTLLSVMTCLGTTGSCPGEATSVSILQHCADWIAAHGPEMLSRLVSAVIIFAIGFAAILLLKRVLRVAFARLEGDRQMVAHFSASVICKAAWACLILVVLARLGVDVGPLIAGLGVTGFILGFAFQESLGSLASGLMLAFNHPFKVGDRVKVAGFEGTVRTLDMMAVTLDTTDGNRVTIPNKSAWGSPIVNLSANADATAG